MFQQGKVLKLTSGPGTARRRQAPVPEPYAVPLAGRFNPVENNSAIKIEGVAKVLELLRGNDYQVIGSLGGVKLRKITRAMHAVDQVTAT